MDKDVNSICMKWNGKFMVVECDLLGSILGAAATVGTGIIALWIYNN